MSAVSNDYGARAIQSEYSPFNAICQLRGPGTSVVPWQLKEKLDDTADMDINIKLVEIYGGNTTGLISCYL
jgi:hypothetical protein